MKKYPVWAFFATIVFGFIGILIDTNFNLGGSFGVITAIATMGACIIAAMDGTDSDDEGDQK